MSKNFYKILFLALVLILIGAGFYWQKFLEPSVNQSPVQPLVTYFETFPPNYPKELAFELVRFDVSRSTRYLDGREKINLEYTSRNPADRLVAFYQQRLAGAGWQNITVQKEDLTTILKAAKNNQLLTLYFIPQDKLSTKMKVFYSNH